MRQSWYYQQLGENRGPVSGTDLRALARKGAIGPDTLVKPNKDGGWVMASRVAGLFQPTEAAPSKAEDESDSITITHMLGDVQKPAPVQPQTPGAAEPVRYPASAKFVTAAPVLALFIGACSVAASVVAIINSMWLYVPVLLLGGIVGAAGVVLTGEGLRLLMDIEQNTRQ